MPTKAYEYISAQLPIINSLPGEFQEFIDNHGIGTAYRAEDAVSLAEALSSLAKNREIIEGWKVNLDPLKFYFDMNTQYQKYVNLINNIPYPENSLVAPSKVFTI
jgi:glycosyltransferase involved in cell wall biosynthesis